MTQEPSPGSGRATTHGWSPWRRLLAGLAALAALAWGASFVPAARAQQVGECRVISAHATVWSQINESGAVVYYGHALMDTEGCGTSPAEIKAAFRPVAGAPTTCDFRGTLWVDEAACTGGRGAAVSGSPMVISAEGHSEGTGGLARFQSSCSVVLAPLGRTSCAFPLS